MKTSKDDASDSTQAQNSAVINPYALADLLAGQPIPWKELPDTQRVLEQILATPYEELFDPKFAGPLYIGHRLDENMRLVPARSPLLDYVASAEGNDAKMGGFDNLSQYKSLGDLIKHVDLKGILD